MKERQEEETINIEGVKEAEEDNRPVVFSEEEGCNYRGDVITINVAPEVVLKDEIGQHLDDYWADTVISSMGHKWFQIRKEGNKIIIEPVEVIPIE
ncbi:MAG: hypothetical protein KAJ44_01645 [Thermoplasmatales archaeon]|nr:hypothetical protein [Thermoplasmatales archaeon]